jgi:O-antigen/teichoic acid export membrane protein
MTSLLPSLTNAFKKKNNTELSNLINISFKIFANKNYLVTTHMFNSSDAFLIVFAVVVFYFISLVFIYSLIASDNQNKLLKINIVITIFNIV